MEKTIIKLQEAVFHQSEDIERLSSELYTQQKELAQLQKQFAQLQLKLQTITENSNIRPVDEETPPPHY